MRVISKPDIVENKLLRSPEIVIKMATALSKMDSNQQLS